MKIGVFDSGYGGLTILRAIRQVLPQYDYLYLGDNARAPYGTHSFDIIYRYTLEAIRYLIEHDCTLVIVACNTASAKALRSIQQRDLPLINAQRPANRKVNVLGVIRPTVEVVPSITANGHIGILATPATVQSQSYLLELAKISAEREQADQPALVVSQQDCPLWVPLIESGEHNQPGADYFIDIYLRRLFAQDETIDTLVLGCTHYPLLKEQIARHLIAMGKGGVQIIAQGALVADSLADYLQRHAEYREQLSEEGSCVYLTTENADRFAQSASIFLESPIEAQHIDL
ncbi:MAG: glutamate racemase [Paludibacteraceae bacterium]|nr:glutamate racemase [Paludibacteraceae bacterium]MEE1095784.1 glutamate racemase [Paludibacteraceae bacterium]